MYNVKMRPRVPSANYRRWPSLLAQFALLLCSSAALGQGKLGAFEADVNAPTKRVHREHDSSTPGCLSGAMGDALVNVFEFTLLAGGVCSWERVSPEAQPADEPAPRILGEPLIPFARCDLGYQRVSSDIHALDVRAEGGYGPLGVQFELTRYREHAAGDDLDLQRILGVYRMSFGSYVETDLGFGALTVSGDQTTSSFLFSIPLLIHPSAHWGIELRPAWSDRVSDYDVAALLTWRYASLKAGYRWVRSPHESLDGPYVGLSLRL